MISPTDGIDQFICKTAEEKGHKSVSWSTISSSDGAGGVILPETDHPCVHHHVPTNSCNTCSQVDLIKNPVQRNTERRLRKIGYTTLPEGSLSWSLLQVSTQEKE